MIRRSILIFSIFLSFGISTVAKVNIPNDKNKIVGQNEMAEIYEKVRTPYKYGLVVAPQDNNNLDIQPA